MTLLTKLSTTDRQLASDVIKDARGLIRQGRESARIRGHAMKPATMEVSPRTGAASGPLYKATYSTTCGNAGCDAYLMIDTRPMPNGIDICGDSVAVGCPATEVARA